ncbi:CHAD domain-containing protein [Sulfurivermis fontis]|uniref:CHAD domain-containing protein n=1 Tax=Sulfurivermis fontis TaxID=1972068 RepID=UPI000FDBF51E|nr:CHAD domain-containing protein [Sulfurivermis fontis]
MILLAQLPLPQALALLANGYLDEAEAAVRRLDDAADEESLHDTRVALRRLHSLMRAYRDEFSVHVPRKLQRTVRRLARASNPARDAEVQQAWLLRQARGLTATQQEGYRWLLARLQPAALLELEENLQRGVRRLARKLRPHLRGLAQDEGSAPLYAAACAAQAEPLAAEVLAALALIDGPQDAGGAHAARIQVKRLRYLLAPLRHDGSACEHAVARLRLLQDLLGELHDRHVLAELLRDSAAEAAADHARAVFAAAPGRPSAWRPPQIPGLLALADRNQEGIVAIYTELEQSYLVRLDETVRQPVAVALDELSRG